MNREHKLSIVVAFGLILFVGMLVSDHFSTASQRDAAHLVSAAAPPPPLMPSELIDETDPRGQPPIAEVEGDRHLVQRGESLRSICAARYGDSSLAAAVAEFNGLGSPDRIHAGQDIALPPRPALMAHAMAVQVETPTAPVPREETPRMVTYTVRPGDTLSQIAQSLMGSVSQTQRLFELNRDQLPSIDQIQPGMKLRYPRVGG